MNGPNRPALMNLRERAWNGCVTDRVLSPARFEVREFRSPPFVRDFIGDVIREFIIIMILADFRLKFIYLNRF